MDDLGQGVGGSVTSKLIARVRSYVMVFRNRTEYEKSVSGDHRTKRINGRKPFKYY